MVISRGQISKQLEPGLGNQNLKKFKKVIKKPMERHIKKPNPIAKEVRSRRFKSQVVQSKKLYNRKEEKINTLKAAAIKLEE